MATEVEMGMRAGDDIDIGEDITPPLTPLSSALHDSLLSSHCYSCFSPLPPNPFPSLSSASFSAAAAYYCSPICSASDSPIHVSAAEPHLLHLLRTRPSTYPHGDSSDLRAALRLLNSLPAAALPSPRIAGLLTNHHKLLLHHHHRDKIRDGARAMLLARKMRRDENRTFSLDADIVAPPCDAVLEEAVLCLVLTNAVEVQDNTRRTLGIAVYGPDFCWINHSCSPNACYRFLASPSPAASPPCPAAPPPLLIAPSVQSSGTSAQIESGVCSNTELTKDCGDHGPRMVVRSIKRIKKGEEVTVTYTDLLQPKAMRQSELWSRYQFMCSCRRCSASPLTYVDVALEEISAAKFNSFSMNSDININRDKATEKLTEYMDEAIDDYLSMGDPESSCQRLEHVLTHGLCDKQSEWAEETSMITYWLHPLHHLSLNAYTTLASAYKIRANDLSALYSDTDGRLVKAFELSRTSAAYSLLLACATHHLFRFESSLVVSVANFWASAGESLLNLARSSVWTEFVQQDFPASYPYSPAEYRCLNCSLIGKFESCSPHSQVRDADLDYVSREFINCATSFTQKVWNFLGLGCKYLRMVKNPIDFSSFVTSEYSSVREVLFQSGGYKVGSNCETERRISRNEEEGDSDEVRVRTFKLGVHCLLYGGYLRSICYGNSLLASCYVRNILNSEEKLLDPCHEQKLSYRT